MDVKQIRLSVIGFAILLIGLVGVTYAFFNYTRTGAANNIRTGRIYFNTTSGDTLNLTNVFPMDSSEAANAALDSVTLGITGDTSYADGEEFVVTLVDVTNTVNGKEIPMNYIATYTAATGGTIGDANSNYWTAKSAKNANIYLLNATGPVEEGKQVLVGYIKNGATGISGTLSIKAYIDSDRIAISDTYYENATTTPTPTAPNDEYGTTTEWVDDENATTTPTPTAPNDEYGTTTEWVDGRTVLTTTEWNSLGTTPISFKIRAESQEGLWVEEPFVFPTMAEMCPNCKFMLPYNEEIKWGGANNPNATEVTDIVSDIATDYEDLNTTSFIGFTETQDGKVDRIFACGIYSETQDNETPFCIEATSNGSKYNYNNKILNSLYGQYNTDTYLGCHESEYNPGKYECIGTTTVWNDNNGRIDISSPYSLGDIYGAKIHIHLYSNGTIDAFVE